jgi:N-acetylglucosamine malate deacetylase 1
LHIECKCEYILFYPEDYYLFFLLDKKFMRILCIGAHPDDIECMAGGSIAKWTKEGHEVFGLTLTHGSWTSPDGIVMRNPDEAVSEENQAAGILGYAVENLGLPMDISFSDGLVVDVLRRIQKYSIDTIVCPWEQDQSHDHEITARVALAASKKVPRVLMGQVNHYVRKFFTPNIFVDISSTWEKKVEALKVYQSEWKRAGQDWNDFLDATGRYYGKIVGAERAEGFISNKFLI